MNLNLRELAQFLVKAKKNTYAGGGAQVAKVDNSKNLQFTEGQYLYRDRYFGDKLFGGQEVVWQKQEPIWLMNYNGGITKNILDPETVFAFLREALMKVSIEKPFRGPLSFRRSDLEYKNSVSGDIAWFKGTEEISHRGEIVYRVEYSGGILK